MLLRGPVCTCACLRIAPTCAWLELIRCACLPCCLRRTPLLAAQVASALQQAALGLGMGGEAFLATFNKSVPTALGLLGEPAQLDVLGANGVMRPCSAPRCGYPFLLSPLNIHPPAPAPPLPALQPSLSLCTPSTALCTLRSMPRCAPPCAASSASPLAARRLGSPSATATTSEGSSVAGACLSGAATPPPVYLWYPYHFDCLNCVTTLTFLSSLPGPHL